MDSRMLDAPVPRPWVAACCCLRLSIEPGSVPSFETESRALKAFWPASPADSAALGAVLAPDTSDPGHQPVGVITCWLMGLSCACKPSSVSADATFLAGGVRLSEV